MEKLSLNKFSDKKLENMKVVKGGKLEGTTWQMSDGSSHGVDWHSTDTDEVGGFIETK